MERVIRSRTTPMTSNMPGSIPHIVVGSPFDTRVNIEGMDVIIRPSAQEVHESVQKVEVNGKKAMGTKGGATDGDFAGELRNKIRWAIGTATENNGDFSIPYGVSEKLASALTGDLVRTFYKLGDMTLTELTRMTEDEIAELLTQVV